MTPIGRRQSLELAFYAAMVAAAPVHLTTSAQASGVIDLSHLTDIPDAASRRVVIQKALDMASKTKNATIIFPSDCAIILPQANGACFRVADAQGLTVLGKNTKLIFAGPCSAFNFIRCSGLTIQGFDISWKDPNYFVADVLNAQGLLLDLKLWPQFTKLEAPSSFASVFEIPHKNAKRKFDFPEKSEQVIRVSDEAIRLKFSSPPVVVAGTPLILRISLGPEMASFADCTNIMLNKVFVRSCPGMGFTFANCIDISVIDSGIFPETSTTPISSNADGFHLSSCSGNIHLKNIVFSHTGDDCINIHSNFLKIEEQNANYISVRTRSIDEFGVGQIVANRNPYTLAIEKQATVTKMDRDGLLTTLFLSNTDGFASGGYLDNMTNTLEVLIEDCTFSNTRARGVLTHENTAIRNCRFENVEREGVLLSMSVPGNGIAGAPDVFEGSIVQNISIQDSNFEFCCANTPQSGAITIAGKDNVSKSGISESRFRPFHKIDIERNTFSGTPVCITAFGIDGLALRKNDTRGGAIEIKDCSNVSM